MIRPRAFLDDTRAATGAEFALVLPLMLLFLLGIIDVGLYGWAINRSEKATQAGARMAVVTESVAAGLESFDYVGTTIGGTTLKQGDTIPADDMVIQCTKAGGCTCTSCPSGMAISLATGSPSPLDRIIARMQQLDPAIEESNVIVQFHSAGVGYAGDPHGMDIAPLVTVRLINMDYSPITLALFSGTVPLPSSSYTLTMEDGSGTASN